MDQCHPIQPGGDLRDIDDSVAALQHRIEQLQLEKAHILALCAPVRRVPPEILSRVFELGARNCVDFSTTICSVSKLWNSIAMNTAVVWSNVVLAQDWSHGFNAFLRKAEVYLQRSQASPLLVDLDMYCVESVDTAHAILSAIAPHVERCYSFHISVPRPEWMELVSDRFGGKLAERMEIMSLRFRPNVPWGSAFAPSTILEGAMPHLTSLTLEGLPLTIIKASLPRLRKLEYKQFEEIYAYPQNPGIATPLPDLLALLETSCTLQELRIEHCTFAVEDADLPFDDNRPVVHLPRLHTLVCAHVDPAYITLLLESIDAPALRRLSLRCDSMRQVQDVWWFPRSPSSTLRGVRHLELEGFRLMDGTALVAFLRMLHALPDLASLALCAPYATHGPGALFDVLSAPARSGAWVAPHLRDISVSLCHGLGGSELLALARARAAGPGAAPLRRVAIQGVHVDAPLVEQLREVVPTVLYAPPHALPGSPPSPMPWGQPVFFS